MFAISPDMRKAAPACQDMGRPHVLQTGQRRKDVPTMAHLAPATVTISVAELRSIQQRASDLAVMASFILEDCGVDYTHPVPTVIPDNRGNVVVDLAAARARRQAVTR
jgi:hypothetical protein